MHAGVHLDLDGAWDQDVLGLPRVDLREWGPKLRYLARRRDVEPFWDQVKAGVSPFLLYGSGDFHHLAGLLLRRIGGDPVTLVSFDNHPDWDIRPPYWSCGGWAARAVRSGLAKHVSVWGCGNFELRFPARLFADRKLLRSGALEVHPWAERQSAAVQRRFPCMRRSNWREQFEQFMRSLVGDRVYITIDMDCLRAEEAVTNWENGLFEAEDVAWAAGQLKQRCRVVGGDICGAYSPPIYERWGQRFAGNWDHPKLGNVDPKRAREVNQQSLAILARALFDQI